jgi:hypothetical protein
MCRHHTEGMRLIAKAESNLELRVNNLELK